MAEIAAKYDPGDDGNFGLGDEAGDGEGPQKQTAREGDPAENGEDKAEDEDEGEESGYGDNDDDDDNEPPRKRAKMEHASFDFSSQSDDPNRYMESGAVRRTYDIPRKPVASQSKDNQADKRAHDIPRKPVGSQNKGRSTNTNNPAYVNNTTSDMPRPRVLNESEFWVYKTSEKGAPPFKVTKYEAEYNITDHECHVRVFPFPRAVGQEGKGFYFTESGHLKAAKGSVYKIIQLRKMVVVTPRTVELGEKFALCTVNGMTRPPEVSGNPQLGQTTEGFWVSHAGYLKFGLGVVVKIVDNLEIAVVEHPEQGSFL
ncbi:hypothetical protein BJY00DRAFT_313577 [Aspergillus carlsbadensis]|nr:hypothetical protein BJY00DRAFT_313577 [Aspergillus carlsbadensis]